MAMKEACQSNRAVRGFPRDRRLYFGVRKTLDVITLLRKNEELKMAKKIYEEGAKDRFLRDIEGERGEKWEVSAEDCATGPGTRTDFDYQLRFGSKRIALETMWLVIDGLAEAIAQHEISSALGTELMRRGVEDVTIWTPSFNVSKAHRRQFVQEVADKLEPVAKSCTREVKVCVNGYTYTVDPSPGIGSVWFVCTNGYYASDPGGQLLQLISVLRQKLTHKNRQLSVAGHERIVLLVCLEGMIKTEDVREAISNIDFSCLPNIDKVYFGSGMERINLVYDRSKFSFVLKGGSGQ